MPKRLKTFKPELVTAAFPEKELRDNPKQINKGLCMRWAYMAFLMFEDVELWSIGAHAFIKYQGKFYDSERLQGEEDWRDLPACNWGRGCGCVACVQKGARKMSLKTFQKFWMGNRIKPDWKQYKKLAQAVLKDSDGEIHSGESA